MRTCEKDDCFNCIKSHEKAKDVTVVKMEDASGNVKGEGFMSVLVILKAEAIVDGETETYSWVVKSMPRDPNRAMMSIKMKADEREVKLFGNLLTKLKDFLRVLLNCCPTSVCLDRR